MNITVKELIGPNNASMTVSKSTTTKEFASTAAEALGYAKASDIGLICLDRQLDPSDSVSVIEAGLKEGSVVLALRNYKGGELEVAPTAQKRKHASQDTIVEAALLLDAIEEIRCLRPDKLTEKEVHGELQKNKEWADVTQSQCKKALRILQAEDKATEIVPKPKYSPFWVNPVVGRKIHATQVGWDGDTVLQFSENPTDILCAGGGDFELDPGGGLRVKGVKRLSDLVGKKIEKLEYREWRKSGPGPSISKRQDGPILDRETGPVLFFEGGAKLFAVNNASGSSPANMSFYWCDGEECGEFAINYQAD